MRVLVVEDHLEIARGIATMLTRRNYAVTLAHEGPRGLDLLREEAFDLAVVDIVLPGLDGFSVCREARRAGVETPVLMLTAREEVEDRVRGLDAGADDYLVKPFAEEELAARLRSLARRGRLPLRETIRIGDLTLDVGARSVSYRGSPVPLAATEFRLFELLARNRGLVLSRDRILDKVWGNGFDGESNIVDVYVSAIRRKLRAAGAKECIRTSRGLGYTLDG
ncbi:MAG: two-component system, OmpR family, response regulator [Candidatus Eremiobacteraeota bacterium]|jgi:DNA-binding response OmpR family regulator|nr:two-component system, OmpR family, response regulator [Candidatus Eremiobacteraeota bacterium]